MEILKNPFWKKIGKNKKKYHKKYFSLAIIISLPQIPGFGIGNQNQGPILLSVLDRFFFRNRKKKIQFLFQASKFFHAGVGRKFGFRGTFMMEKNTSC